MRRTLTILLLLLLSLLYSCDLSDHGDTFALEGTVKSSAIELGCWFILATDDTRYEPINMPEELKQDGLFIKLIVRPRKETASVCMVGQLVEIVRVVETGQGRSE